jgi:hypothetical protein
MTKHITAICQNQKAKQPTTKKQTKTQEQPFGLADFVKLQKIQTTIGLRFIGNTLLFNWFRLHTLQFISLGSFRLWFDRSN